MTLKETDKRVIRNFAKQKEDESSTLSSEADGTLRRTAIGGQTYAKWVSGGTGWVCRWIGEMTGPTAQSVFRFLKKELPPNKFDDGAPKKAGRTVRATSTRARAPVDEQAARELALYIVNDATLYTRQRLPIEKNLLAKLAKGKFDAKLAPKLYKYLADEGAKKYVKEYGGSASTFSPATRERVAQDLTDDFIAEHVK